MQRYWHPCSRNRVEFRDDFVVRECSFKNWRILRVFGKVFYDNFLYNIWFHVFRLWIVLRTFPAIFLISFKARAY